MDSFIEEVIKEVRLCGMRMLQAGTENKTIDVKGARDFVTEYDRQNQEQLAQRLPQILPGSVFVGEEEDQHASIREGFAFICDPIDGTTNFIKDYHMSAISVGVTKDGELYAGVIYNPYLDEMYYAQKGCGAFMNGKRIHVSEQPLSEGIVIFGTALYYKELADETFRLVREYFNASLDIRRSGSAAVDLCALACGRGELFFELRLNPWDYAAGAMIVEEAGGRIVQMDKTPITLDRPCSILATNKGILNSLADPWHPMQ